ncbi:MAG TPA: hypothetical protein VM692_10320, partial [Gammaproteobacteria bacterium]|nr:hypothetical protein [Gammaproteobacteria bacterium]
DVHAGFRRELPDRVALLHRLTPYHGTAGIVPEAHPEKFLTSQMDKWEFFQDAAKLWRWRCTSADGHRVFDSALRLDNDAP